MKQYRNPNLWLLDATSAACPTAVRVSENDRRRFDIDPLPPRPTIPQRHLQSPYSRSLHRRYASLRRHSRFPHALGELGVCGPGQAPLGGPSSPCSVQRVELHKDEPPARWSSMQSKPRPSSVVAGTCLERLQSLQQRRQQSAHR